MKSSPSRPYVTLLNAFIEGRISASEFEELYLFMFKNDPGEFDPKTYDALNTLFGQVDAFCADPALREQTSDGIGPGELRRAAQAARELLSP